MRTLTRKPAKRRGMTVVLVLGLLSITLALSYAMLRTQTTAARIQANQNRLIDARQAAMTGMQVALRRMHEANWAGVDAPVSGSLGTGVGYSVTFATGDAKLTAGHADRAKYPYRVTLTSTGTALDDSGTNASTHTVRAIVEFVPRALSSQPSNWASLQNHTLRQWSNTTAVIQPPVRIVGPVHMQGPLSLCPDYPPDCRPFDGRIDEVGVFNKALSALEVSNLTLYASISPNFLFASNYNAVGPAHWWRFNEASGASTAAATAGGVSGSYQNGAASGASGLSGSAASFDGYDDYISTGNINVIGNQLTLLALVRANSWRSTDARIISKATGTAEDETYWMLSTTQVGHSMRLRFRVRAGGSTKTLVASSGNLSTGTWYLAAGVYNGSDMILYLNGTEVGRTSKSGNLATDNTVPVFIGDCPPGSPRTRYLRDLEAMRVAGLGDWRPWSGPIELPRSRTDAHTLRLLETQLATATTNVNATTSAPLSHPGAVSSYRLYPGGKSYSVAVLPGEMVTTNLAPDVETNPLGIFRRSGRVELHGGVSVQGTIITTGTQSDVCVVGNQVQLSAATLPNLVGSSTPIQLPVVLAADDVSVGAHSGTSLSGLVMAWDEFRWEEGTDTASCTLEGKLFCSDLQLRRRTEWNAISAGSWESWLTAFVAQLSGSSSVPHFPTWVDDREGFCYEPLLTIRPATTAVTYHWQDWTQPIFARHASDAGLVWKIIRWEDDAS